MCLNKVDHHRLNPFTKSYICFEHFMVDDFYYIVNKVLETSVRAKVKLSNTSRTVQFPIDGLHLTSWSPCGLE